MNSVPVFSRARYDEHVLKIKQACQWLGISQGRAATYARLVQEFFEDATRTQEHILAYNESHEITDLFDLWEPHIDQFLGLREKLCCIYEKGPILRESENFAASSNRSRNDAFSCLVSGTLLNAGINVVAVEGKPHTDFIGTSNADLSFEWESAYFDVECKRPQTEKALVPRMREARTQLEQAGLEKRPGVVAFDCSTLIRPPGTLLEYELGERAEAQMSSILEKRFMPILEPYLTPYLLGIIFVARVPGMMRLNESLIVNPQGYRNRRFRPDTILTWLVVVNSNASASDVLKTVSERIKRYQVSKRHAFMNNVPPYNADGNI